MAAPDATLATKIARGEVARHLLFRLDHSQGELFLWDGIGEIAVSGNTYRGVGGFGQISGVSDSTDIQNHEVLCSLNGVSLPGLVLTDTDIEGRAASITAIWLDEAGTVQGSLLLFSGTGDVLRVKPDTESRALTAKLKAPLVEWRAPPLAYWTDADQQRRYPGDMGLTFIKTLEGSTVAGWSIGAETTGGFPNFVTFERLLDSVTQTIIGDHTNGPTVRVFNPGSGPLIVHSVEAQTNRYTEETTTSQVFAPNPLPGPMQAGGANCYIDVAGDVRTPGGNRVIRTGLGVTRRLRRQTAITANGAATAVTISAFTVGSAVRLRRTDVPFSSLSQANQQGLIYADRLGVPAFSLSATQPQISGVNVVEEVTGAAVTVSGGLLRVGATNCVMSVNGVVLTPSGRRVIKTGEPASFLRCWT